jgi:predicted aminopeptidase
MRRLTMAVLGTLGLLAATAVVVCLTTGCAGVGYLSQSVGGHVSLMNSAKPIDEWTADPATPEPLRQRLLLSQRMRAFAVTELKLPDNSSYRRYADLGRRAAVWNVVAAPPLSLSLKTSCFPVVGCVGYRGFYREEDAKAAGEQLARDGLEVNVYPVPAYSTLGKLEWLGGDPLLNTFVNQHEGDLARLIFHELSHQVAFAKDDTTLNESFATAVERIGGKRWLDQHASAETRESLARSDAMRADFRALVGRHREALDALYKSALPDSEKLAQKANVMARMRQDHAEMKQARWGGNTSFDGWFARANNATVGVMAAYNAWVPAFERLFEQQGHDFERFYAQAKRLAALPREERHATLQALLGPAPSAPR